LTTTPGGGTGLTTRADGLVCKGTQQKPLRQHYNCSSSITTQGTSIALQFDSNVALESITLSDFDVGDTALLEFGDAIAAPLLNEQSLPGSVLLQDATTNTLAGMCFRLLLCTVHSKPCCVATKVGFREFRVTPLGATCIGVAGVVVAPDDTTDEMSVPSASTGTTALYVFVFVEFTFNYFVVYEFAAS
jgi:hypothetical protein